MSDNLRALVKLSRRLPGLLSPLRPGDAARILGEELRKRDRMFLEMLETNVFGRPDSPYLAMLLHAGITRPEIEELVRAEGVEGTLKRLCSAGVYVTLDEVKGRRPIRRGSLAVEPQAGAFAPSNAAPCFFIHTGGSSGRRERVTIDIDSWHPDAVVTYQLMDEFGVLERPRGLWRPFFPGGLAFIKIHGQTRSGRPPARWFSQVPVSLARESWPYHGFWLYFVAGGLLRGQRIPFPRHVPPERAVEVTRWLADLKAAGTPAYFDTNVSSGVRLCRAAVENDIDISGTFLRLGSEPFTPARAEVIESAGCTAGCTYAMVEGGTVGLPCADREHVDEVHVMSDAFAFIQPGSAAPAADLPSTALFMTALRPDPLKVLINYQSGDAAHLTRRRCSCALTDLGFDLHLHTIRAFDKLTAEGMHILPFDLHSLVEEVLPATFGGGPTDYQLLERDSDDSGRVAIVVSPRVGDVDDDAVVETTLRFLREQGAGERMMASIFRGAGTLRVLRQEPHNTPASKMKPFHREHAQS